MPQLIKPNQVKVVTQNGEVLVNITLDLNINLNTNEIGITTSAVKTENVIETQKDNFDWEIPDFQESPKLNFGKKEN